MLVQLKEVLEYAERHRCAIGAFNTPTLENIIAVIEAAEQAQVPVILMHAQCHEELSPLDDIGPVMLLFARRATIPVCVHLDHGEDLAYIERALQLGFTSVMYDGSLLPYDINVSHTQEAVALARKAGASVEAEIGILGGREAGNAAPLSPEKMYTDPDVAKRFVEDTGIDALACSFGTAHGIYKVAPKLDFDRIEKIRSLVGIPLVMHGGSGVSEEDYRRAIRLGIRKINYYSYMAREGVYAAKDILKNDITFYHDIARYATVRMKENAAHAIQIFSDPER